MNNKQKIAEAKARVSQLTENRINIYDLRLNETLNLTEKKKKLDPVDAKELEGDWEDREDADIDNDGDEDESDVYLHNRRKTIKKAMKKDEKECDCDMEDDDEHDEDCPMYKMKKEEFEQVDEAKTDIYHKHMLKALGKSQLPKNHPYTSAIASNGDFVVHDGGGRVVGRIPKGEHNLSEATIDYKVNVEGLPPMFIDAKNPGDVKMKLRKLLRRPDSIGDVTRITKADLKKYFRIKGMGKDPEEMSEAQ